jgi:uncharacterized protein YjbJ (UPF0337 family)
MSFLDKLLGRSKQAAGDMTGDAGMKHEGMHQEKEGKAEEHAAMHEEHAQEARKDAAEHHAERDS